MVFSGTTPQSSPVCGHFKERDLIIPTNNGGSGVRKAPRRFRPFLGIVKFLTIFVLVGIIACCIIASVLTVYVLDVLEGENDIKLENVKLGFTTILYSMDTETNEYVELSRMQTNENRIWVDFADIPEYMKNAAIAVEDQRFETHFGIDIRRTVGSAINMIFPIYDTMSGGSTITQQLIKNITGDNAVEVERKIREIFNAIKLEREYSKDQILESYLNTIALGNGTNGVEAAANLYFGKSVGELTLAECASIISITNNPTYYNPFTNPENNKERQMQVLRNMLAQGLISQEEFDAAEVEELNFLRSQYTETVGEVQDWFMDTVIEEVVADMMEQLGYTYSGAHAELRNGGYQIYTTVDTEMQDYLTEAYINPETFPTVRNEEYPESAFVIMDLQGQIKAIAGSNREKEGALLFNRATDAVRHPGSAIKPVATYALAIEYGYVNWSSIWEDSPIQLDPEDPLSLYPKNHYNTYLGDITINEALQRSTNTIPVKLQQTIGTHNSFNFLVDELGFSTLVEADIRNGQVFSDINIAPMALGAMTDGVTLLELVASYQIFGNGGYFYEPHSYTQVVDSEGKVILENAAIPERVISPETADVMNKLMQMVTRGTYGTGVSSVFSAMPVAGKTGTSDNDENQWFVGVTPYYVGGVWVGYDTPEMVNYSGYPYPPPTIYRNVMGPVHEGLEIKDFNVTGNIVEQSYCTVSGHLPTFACETTATGWYKMTDVIPPCDECMEDDDLPTSENPFDDYTGYNPYANIQDIDRD